MKKFKFLENIATADSAFEAYGKTYQELFENAALALFETMAKTKKIKPIFNFQFSIFNLNLEDLLYDFLSELVFLKDKKGMVFSKFKVEINPKLAKLRSGRVSKMLNLKAWVWGETIDANKHKLKVDVKAVTRHQFGIKKEKDKFAARVVLDI